MKIYNKTDFLELPAGTVFQKYEPRVTTSGLCIKGENVGADDFYLISLDAVDSLGCTQEIEDKLESGSDFRADYSKERDGMHCPDDQFIVFDRDDVKGLMVLLWGGLS